jgi:hypothetical protein
VFLTPSRIAAALLLALGLVLPVPAADPPRPPSKERVAEWVRGLSSDSFEEREAASKALWKAGQAAEPALRKLLKDGDAEAVRRAREILDKFEWGLYPHTPEAVSTLIEEYRSGTPESRAALVPKLLDQGSPGFTALMKIAAKETEPETKTQIWQLLAADMPRLAAALIAEGQDARLEEILEQGLTGEGEQPHANYAAFLTARGKLDDKLREWQKKAPAPDKKTALTLAYLCRAKGDLPGARKYAEKAEHAALIQTVLAEQEDWKALLKQIDSAPPPEDGVRPVGLRLACLRLMGDREGFAAEVGKLTGEPSAHPGLASALLLNGRLDDALMGLRRTNDHVAAAGLLATRLRFREALDELDKAAAPEKGGDPTAARLAKASLLARLGERKKAREVFDKVLADVKADDVSTPQLILTAESNAGFKDEAFARAATLMGKGDDAGGLAILNLLFPPSDVETGCEPWWTFLRGKFPKDDAAARLKRLRDLLGHKMSAREVGDLLRELADEAAKQKPEEREKWLHCAAETCQALSRADLLEGYLEKWAAAGGDARAWLRLGDVAADAKRWKDAAERYRRAWEKDRSDALPLYLRGRALVQAGQEKDGRRWMEAAEAVPLGSEDRLALFAAGLGERGLDEAAAKQWERLARVTLLNVYSHSSAARALAERAAALKDYGKAATYTRREALCYLAQPFVDDAESLLWLVAAERRYRARALAAAGRLDDMRKEISAALDVGPNIDLAIDLVTELTKRGQKKEADDLFARVYAAHDAVCKEHPQSSWARNNTAWLAVRCKRNLDAALEHAKKAAELNPGEVSHLDTLAEVHFQRGDKDKAVELEKKCVEMQPRYDYFRKQLKRLQAGDRDAEVPPEPSLGQSVRSPSLLQ